MCGHTPLILTFFVTGSPTCTRQVDALQAISRRPAFHSVSFAAVAVRGDRRTVLAEVHRHRWTLPVAYDRDGSVGDLYGVMICPLVEVIRSDGTIARRLIGEHWSQPAALAGAAEAAEALPRR